MTISVLFIDYKSRPRVSLHWIFRFSFVVHYLFNLSSSRIDILLPKSMKEEQNEYRLDLEGSSIHFGRKTLLHSIHLLFIEQFILILPSSNLLFACSQQIVLYFLLCFSPNFLTYLLDIMVCVNLIVPFVSSIISPSRLSEIKLHSMVHFRRSIGSERR